MMATLWAQEIMSAETMEEAKALYERCPPLAEGEGQGDSYQERL
mgnify:CR=1 FL=1